jgi:hypothetical protein
MSFTDQENVLVELSPGGVGGMCERISSRRLPKGFERADMKTSGSKGTLFRSVTNDTKMILVRYH